MKTFQDLMKEQPEIVTTNTNQHVGTTNDILSRWYNMYWGSMTDTHMQLMDDGLYYITGSRISKQFLDGIMYAMYLGDAPNTPMPHTFYELLNTNNLNATLVKYNGQNAIIVGPNEKFDGEIRIPPRQPAFSPYRNCCMSCNPCMSMNMGMDDM